MTEREGNGTFAQVIEATCWIALKKDDNKAVLSLATWMWYPLHPNAPHPPYQKALEGANLKHSLALLAVLTDGKEF
jgi:hypothetical protein